MTSPDSTAPATWRSLFSHGLGLYVIMLNLGIGLHAVDVFVVSTVMPDVVRDLGGAHFYAWSTMLYMVASIIGAAATAPLRLRFGGRRAYCAGAILFLIGSVSCATAPNMELFIIARFVQGFGGGIVLSRSMAMVGELFPEHLKKPILALISSTWGVAALIGPALGGSFAAFHFWRGAFWFNLPFVLLFLGVALTRLPADKTQKGEIPQFPFGRLALLVAGVMSIGIASEGANLAERVGLIVLALVLVFVTFTLDRRGLNRIFPSQPLSWRTTTGTGYWVMFLASMTHTVIGVFLPLALQELHGQTPIAAGYMMAILAIGWTAASVFTAKWQGAKAFTAMVCGLAFCVIGLVSLALGVVVLPPLAIAAFNGLVGIGLGSSNLHVVAATMRHAAKGEESITASSIPTMRSLGIAFGAAAAGAIANAAGLTDALAPADVAHAVTWVLSVGALAPMLGLVFVWRFIALVKRQAI
ncbi:MFS transporter [Dongia rigui]|uniref:MFS transporter n=1 Tax=Dongia rigui TaxID=940149 RepID=A0ABU5DZP7_9PROT|nr:MFS transporter [Dongia rigui]MDY0872668.1 MFS transporter [Dongia rigui]